jgi:hypothetical protein
LADDFSTSFAFDLDSNMPQVAAESAESIYELREAIRAGSDELRGLQSVMRAFKGTAGANSDTVKALSDRISAQKAQVATAAQQFAKLGVAYGSVKNPADKLKLAQEANVKAFLAQASAQARLRDRWHEGFTSIEQWRSAMLRAGKAQDQLRLDRATKNLAFVRSGAIAVAAAYVGIVGAVTAAAAATLRYGVMTANARRSELLHLEGLTKLRYGYWAFYGAMVPAHDKASFLQKTIDETSASTALARDKVAEYTEQLYRMGLRSGNLQAAVEGITTVASVQGESAAQAWLGMAMGSAMTGRSVRALADDIKARLGPIAARQMLDWNVQSAKLREKFAMLFSGIKVEKLLKGVDTLTRMFSLSKAEGRALKVLIETVFQPLIDFAGGPGAMLVKRFFQGIILAAQDLTIFVLGARLALDDAFGTERRWRKWSENVDLLNYAVAAGGAAFGAILAPMIPVGVMIALIGANAYGAYKSVTLLAGAVRDLYSAVSNSVGGEAQGAGSNIVAGIVDGIVGGRLSLISAMVNLAKAGVGAFKGANEIHSPSALFRRTAINIPKGAALGIDDGQPDVARSIGRMVPEGGGMPRSAQSAKSEGGESVSRTPSVIQFGDVYVQGQNSGEQVDDFMRKLEKALAGISIQLGAPVNG